MKNIGIAKINTKPSERFHQKNANRHKIGTVNSMSRITTGSRARIKVRYSEELKNAIEAAL